MSDAPRRRSSKRKDAPKPTAVTWFVYILRCADGTFYTGITTDLERRIRQHNAGTASRYTRSRLPIELIYREPQPNRSSALQREAAIKALSRQEKARLIRSAPPLNAARPGERKTPRAAGRAD